MKKLTEKQKREHQKASWKKYYLTKGRQKYIAKRNEVKRHESNLCFAKVIISIAYVLETILYWYISIKILQQIKSFELCLGLLVIWFTITALILGPFFGDDVGPL